MIFVGVDWAEAYNQVVVMDEAGVVCESARLGVGVAGLARLHELVGAHATDPAAVVVGLEVDRGLLVDALVGAGYVVYGINPLAASRYRARHVTSRAKSDSGDAKMLAEVVRTDRHNHRPLASDSAHVDAIRVLARAHQGLIWDRHARMSRLRAALRDYFPAALEAFSGDLAGGDALAVLAIASTPDRGRALSGARIRAALARGGRMRNLERRAQEIQAILRAPQPQTAPVLASALGETCVSHVAILIALNQQIARLESSLSAHFEEHPDAEILSGLPGLGSVLGARVLGEFGDDPSRYTDAKARKAYAGTAPITRASGRSHLVSARVARNRRLDDACELWAFSSLTASPGARHYYDTLRARGKTHRQALRQLANRWVGILHACLERRMAYREEVAWPAVAQTHTIAA